MRKVKVFRNQRTSGRAWFMVSHLPIRQTLIFVGPVLVLVRP
jgi:hypothetical protein